MVKITCYIRPFKLEEVKTAIADLGVSGMSVSDVRGCGNSPEQPSYFGGQEYLVSLPIKSKLVVVVEDELREAVVEAIVEHARTGEPGDGKVFVEPVSDALRIRTLERGDSAV